jgi:hypothetical protein
MVVKVANTSTNPDTGKQYDRTLYVCQKDDVWVSVETPKET